MNKDMNEYFMKDYTCFEIGTLRFLPSLVIRNCKLVPQKVSTVHLLYWLKWKKKIHAKCWQRCGMTSGGNIRFLTTLKSFSVT